MTKDVLITVSGLRLENDGREDIELVTAGRYYEKGGKEYILYDEYLQDTEEAIKCNIIIDRAKGKVDIIKYGPANVHMVFENSKKNSSYYQTPFGSLLVGFYTTDLDINKEEEIRVNIKYNLEVNHNHISENDIHIKVQLKN